MHSPRVFAASSVHQGKFYGASLTYEVRDTMIDNIISVMGGFGLSRDAREDVEVYDPQTDRFHLQIVKQTS